MYSSQDKNLKIFLESTHEAFKAWMAENNIDSVEAFGRMPEYAKYKDDAYFLQNMRNIAAHGTLKYIEVLDSGIARIEKFVAEVMPKSLENKMVRINKLHTAKMKDRVLPELKTLRDNNYSYLPIINDRKVCEEVFSSYVLMSYICAGNIIDDTTTFEDIYVKVTNELQDTYCFLPLESSLREVIESLKVTDDFHQDVVLITEDGDPESPLLGMITVWDLQ